MDELLLCIDCETTGVRASDKVVEVAWTLLDRNLVEVERHSSLINPLIPIPSDSSAVHGITNRDVEGAPTIEQYFFDVLGNRFGINRHLFTAYNSGFDFRFLGPYMVENTRQFDLLKVARRLYPEAPNHKLATLVYELGLDVSKDRFHSADGDVDVLVGLLQRMVSDSGMSVEELTALANAPNPNQKMFFGKHKGVSLKDLPPNYVWWLLNKADNLDADLRAALQALQ